MKKFLALLMLFFLILLSAQKRKENILESKSIPEIENYLKNAHPQDPKRTVLRAKLISLKNEWMKSGSKPYEPAKPTITAIPPATGNPSKNSEQEEFEELMNQSTAAKNRHAAQLLSQLFDNDTNSDEAILFAQNNSDCNMIMRISGKNYYNLAVPRHGENSIVIKKGEYLLTSNLCDAKYSSVKIIDKNMMITLKGHTSRQ